MNKMQLIRLTLAIGLISPIRVFSQQTPTNTNPGGASSGTNSQQYWSRVGNTDINGDNNIFGTFWNSPIYTYTDGTNRTRLNGSLVTNLNGVTSHDVSGYFGIAPNGYFATNTPWSMLHLDGDNNTPYSGNGWRKWMKTGVFMKEHSDAMYVGLKQENGTNRSDAVINWSDDQTTNGGVDKLRFLFTAPASTGNGNNSNPKDGLSLNGYEFMRMQTYTTINNTAGFPVGHIGIGPMFDNTNVPHSRLHINAEDRLATYLQITNESETGQNSSDGIRLGIYGQAGTTPNPMHGTALMYQQENRALLFSTARNTNSFDATNTLERVRIMQIGTPTLLPGGGFGVYNPGALNTNFTRMSVSHNPANPVTRPLSLMHLGYNTGIPAGGTDGWRSWMDIGTFTSNGTDHVYVGLKREQINNRNDAVINWGDDGHTATPLAGPDNLRFIFTEPQTSGSGSPAAALNGIEVARMTGKPATTLPANFGMMGIGDYSPTGPNALPALQPNAKLDIDGDLRIRTVNYNNTLNQVLVIDSSDLNRVYWREIPTGLGNYCGTPTNTVTDDYEIDMADNHMYFRNGGTFNFANVVCGNPLPARVNIRNTFSLSGVQYPIGLLVEQQSTLSANNIGIQGSSTAGGVNSNIGIKAIASGGTTFNYGVYASANYTPGGPGGPDFAVYCDGDAIVTGTYVPSDVIFKQHIDTITNAMNIIEQLKPFQYFYDTTGYINKFNFSEKIQYGFIAQDVMNILPSLVQKAIHPEKIDSTGNIISPETSYLAMNYQGLIAILAKGIQEQDKAMTQMKQTVSNRDSIIETLEARISAIESCLTNTGICNTPNALSPNTHPNAIGSEVARQQVELKDMERVVLDQNVPNPFAEQTIINYYLPQNVQRAQMLFYDHNGRLINTVDLNGTGAGQLQVFANDLSNGIYQYVLVVDGEITESKKMVKMD